MTLPKMIIFDYGQTLGDENGYRVDEVWDDILARCDSNPRGATGAKLRDTWLGLFEKLGYFAPSQDNRIELHNGSVMRYALEYNGVRHSLGDDDFDNIFWDGAAMGTATPHLTELLDFLAGRNIRTGVISNLMYSERALVRRIAKILPGYDRFEFTFASSDCLFQKPSPLIFELGIRRSGLVPSDIWYCGDSAINDCAGSSAVGIFPVWYTGAVRETSLAPGHTSMPPACEHLHINDWRELITALERLDA